MARRLSLALLILCRVAATLGWMAPQGVARPPLRHAPPRCIFGEILEEAKLVRGGAVVEQPVLFDADSDEAPFDIDRWNKHRSPTRYGYLVPGILIGPTTRRISGTVGGLVLWAALVGLYNDVAGMDETLLGSTLPSIQLPLTPFELTSPVLGLLLVFRTDTANDRFDAHARPCGL